MLYKEPFVTLEKEFLKPGKSQALNRVKIRKLLSGKVLAPKFYEHSNTEQKMFSNLSFYLQFAACFF